MSSDFQVVAKGLGFPEGPVAMDDGTVLFVDIQKQGLYRLHDSGQVDLVAMIPGGPNGLAIGPDGYAYVCNNGGIFDFDEVPPAPPRSKARAREAYYLLPNPHCPGSTYRGGSINRVNLKTGKVTELYGPSTGHHLIAPDDIVFDTLGPSGAFWFTDCGYQNEGVVMKGGVYRATTDGKSLQKVARVPSANGIGLGPKGDVLFVADTLSSRLWAFTLDLKDRSVIGLGPGAPVDGVVVMALTGVNWLDSLKVEQGGKICMGTLLQGGITVFDPATGAIETVPVGNPIPGTKGAGDPMTSNLCFGGPHMTDVWVTASAEGTIYKGPWPRPGLKLAN